MVAPAVFIAASNGLYAFEATQPVSARDALLALGVSRPAVARIFEQARLAALGASLPPHASLLPGDRFELRVCVQKPVPAVPASPLPQVLYEDPFVLAVNKPAGLLVHGDGTGAPTLADRVAAYLAQRGELYAPQAVQRLDVDTTGVVLFSKTAEFQPLFDALVAGHDMRKRYLAVVRGAFPAGRTVIDAPIARDRHDARRMRVATSGGQAAHTQVDLLAVSADRRRSLLAVELGTGRKHQIRVHLSSRGHPIEGDPLYNPAADTPCELMLHAYEERFEHPVTGEPVVACAGWPQRFSAWFDESCLQAGGSAGSRRGTSRKAGRHGTAR